MKEEIQKKKIITQKLYKNPDDFLYSETFLPYVLSLEEAGDLQRLPENLYVYYVLSVLENEVNNGGFLQFLTNRTKDTFKEVAFCADILNDSELTPLLIDFVNTTNKYFTQKMCDINNAKYDYAFRKQLKAFDNRFYEIDKQSDVHKLILRYYKNNYTVKSIKHEAIKEEESNSCRYFTIPEIIDCNDIEEAVECFLKMLSDFSQIRWAIELWNFYDIYRMEAHSLNKKVDLNQIMNRWSECSFPVSSKGSESYVNRMKICSYFERIIFSSTEGMSEYLVVISSSGFGENEKKMKAKLFGTGIAFENRLSSVSTENMSHKKDPQKYYKIKIFLEKHYKKYSNIEMIFESGK